MKILVPLAAAAWCLASCAPVTPDARIEANPSMAAKLTDAQRAAVRQGRIEAGLPPEGVYLAWGKADREYVGQEGGVTTMRWDYAGTRPVTSTTFFSGYGYGRYSGYGRYRRGYPGYYGSGFGTSIDYIPYRAASVWFRNDRVTRWERSTEP